MSTHEQYSDIPRGQVVGTYDTYVEAQRAVDFLSDEQFPVQHVSIVGSDLKMVENVLGRLTRGRAAAAGAATGAWFGLFVGIVLSLFAKSNTNTFGLIIGAAIYGIVFGAIFGFAGHALSRGQRTRGTIGQQQLHADLGESRSRQDHPADLWPRDDGPAEPPQLDGVRGEHHVRQVVEEHRHEYEDDGHRDQRDDVAGSMR